ncbi:MAG: DUF881 domain-containing protein [Patescibacteria group bacterium]|nr:DUF881 domain-containing protein [Patescibacteria group bacterium]
MFKKNDYIIISIICFFLGIFLISQFYSGKEYKKIIQPENNAVLALEVAKLTKSNADLRNEVQNLTSDLESYKNSTESRQKSFDQYLVDTERLDSINSTSSKTGQGVVIQIKGNLSTAQIVDLVNAIKNIGAEIITINNQRLVLNTSFDKFSNLQYYEIEVLGNSSLLKSAMERKGGIVDQISTKDINFIIQEKDNIEIPAGEQLKFDYARIIKE